MPNYKRPVGRPRGAPPGLVASTLRASIERYLSRVADDLQTGPSGSTVQAKRAILRNLTDTHGDDYPTWMIDADALRLAMVRMRTGADEHEVAERRRQGRPPRAGRRSRSAVTLAEATIRQFCALCHEHLEMSPAVRLPEPLVRSRKAVQDSSDIHPKVWIDHSQWDVILDAAGRTHPRLRMAVAAGFHCGRRVSEIVNLRWSDVDWHSRTLTYFGVKGGHQGEIPLFDDFVAELDRWRAWAEAAYGPVRADWCLVPARVAHPRGTGTLTRLRAHPELWPVVMDEPSPLKSLRTDVRRLMAPFGIATRYGNGSHAFRRSAAQHVRDAAGLDAAQELMGHALRSTTESFYARNTAGTKALRALASTPDRTGNVIPLRRAPHAAEG